MTQVLVKYEWRWVKNMGGKEASRGFVYQGFVSVLEALTASVNWDKIYIEFPTPNDKVDISLEQQNEIIKCIQVKSTVNTFGKTDIITWLNDLIQDVKSPEYELFLIGQCDKSANTFVKSIEKYYSKTLDKEAESMLNGFDTDLLDDMQIRFTILPFDIEYLEKNVRDSLHRYISHNNQMMTFEQIDLIASATIKDQMIASTHGKGIGRKEFDEDLKKRILIVADKYFTKRISIGIKSYASRGENLEDETEHCISFIDRFCDRKIKDGYDWNKDIYRDLEEFLLANTSSKFAYQIFLNTHMSMAFAAGRILNSKSGINVFPIQKTSAYGTVLWDVKPSSKRDYMNWDFTYEKLNENQRDSALVINITHDIYDNVVEYIKENNLSIGRIINCTPCGGGASKFSIEDGTHAAFLAGSVYNSIAGRSIEERRAILHIFPSAPNAFMFFLGQNSVGFGKCILYEYDFELRDTCTYSPSMKFV